MPGQAEAVCLGLARWPPKRSRSTMKSGNNAGRGAVAIAAPRQHPRFHCVLIGSWFSATCSTSQLRPLTNPCRCLQIGPESWQGPGAVPVPGKKRLSGIGLYPYMMAGRASKTRNAAHLWQTRPLLRGEFISRPAKGTTDLVLRTLCFPTTPTNHPMYVSYINDCSCN